MSAKHILFAICVLFCVSSCGKETPSVMPDGWTLQTDGDKWRAVTPNGTELILEPSRRDAVKSAWDFIEYKNRQWEDAK